MVLDGEKLTCDSSLCGFKLLIAGDEELQLRVELGLVLLEDFDALVLHVHDSIALLAHLKLSNNNQFKQPNYTLFVEPSK